MKKDDDKEILKLTAKKLLLSLAQISLPFFQASSIYKTGANKLLSGIYCEKEEISDKIKYLKQMGYIRSFSEKKEKYIEITKKGRSRINQIKSEILEISRPKKWDGKWRIVIFDIPDDKKTCRDRLRRSFRRLRFIMVQESVYVFPFECTVEVDQMADELGVSRFVSMFIADVVRNEELLIQKFLDLKTLNRLDLKT